MGTSHLTMCFFPDSHAKDGGKLVRKCTRTRRRSPTQSASCPRSYCPVIVGAEFRTHVDAFERIGETVFHLDAARQRVQVNNVADMMLDPPEIQRQGRPHKPSHQLPNKRLKVHHPQAARTRSTCVSIFTPTPTPRHSNIKKNLHIFFECCMF